MAAATGVMVETAATAATVAVIGTVGFRSRWEATALATATAMARQAPITARNITTTPPTQSAITLAQDSTTGTPGRGIIDGTGSAAGRSVNDGSHAILAERRFDLQYFDSMLMIVT